MKFVGAFVGGLVVAVLVGVAILYFGDLEVVESSGSSDSISVPGVLGQDTADATAELENAGLEVSVTDESGNAFEETFGPEDGWYETHVRTQNPDPGTEASRGTEVTITVE